MKIEWQGFKEGNWTNEINVSDFIKTIILLTMEMKVS